VDTVKDMVDTPSQIQNMVDTSSQDRRMDNLWATMAHPPMAHLPKVTRDHHVILKATMVLPNKDRHSLKIKLVQYNLI
jgi:hypothetical protein